MTWRIFIEDQRSEIGDQRVSREHRAKGKGARTHIARNAARERLYRRTSLRSHHFMRTYSAHGRDHGSCRGFALNACQIPPAESELSPTELRSPHNVAFTSDARADFIQR